MQQSEFEIKRQRIVGLLAAHQADALWVTQNANMAWLTGGARAYIDTSTQVGVASLLLTATGAYVLTNTIEAPRLRDEEGLGPPWEMIAEPWYAATGAPPARLLRGARLASDTPRPDAVLVADALVQARAPLLPVEIERYAKLGQEADACLYRVAQTLEPSMSEHAVAARVAQATYEMGALPIVILIASAERMQTVRHPLPTARPLGQSVMLVLCAQRHGLIVNLTRLVAFGTAPDLLKTRLAAVMQVDATAILATVPDAPMAQIFTTICEAYAAVGFADAWQGHHQGGPCSYGARDWLVTPTTTAHVQRQQAFAWNPSVPGAKSEDTFVVQDGGPRILTVGPAGAQWPRVPVTISGRRLERPDVLEV